MTEKQDFSQSGDCQNRRELTQTVIDEMKAQGFLDEFTDKDTGEALIEIQFSEEILNCKVTVN